MKLNEYVIFEYIKHLYSFYLQVQLDVFDEQRASDECHADSLPHGVDLTSHLDVFYAIYNQVSFFPSMW